jgi:uncharacterized RDD family membrane protein YckC
VTVTASPTLTVTEEPAPVEYSGIVTRGLAFVIDAAIVDAIAIVTAAAVALMFSVLPGSQRLHGVAVVLAGAAFVLWCVAYWATFWATTGQTPGNRVMRIRVTRADGSHLHAWRAVLRVGTTVLAALPLLLGFVPIMLTDRRRGLNDWLADTVVTRADPVTTQPPPAGRAGRRAPAA